MTPSLVPPLGKRKSLYWEKGGEIRRRDSSSRTGAQALDLIYREDTGRAIVKSENGETH